MGQRRKANKKIRRVYKGIYRPGGRKRSLRDREMEIRKGAERLRTQIRSLEYDKKQFKRDRCPDVDLKRQFKTSTLEREEICSTKYRGWYADGDAHDYKPFPASGQSSDESEDD